MFLVIIACTLILLLLPNAGFAWGPATHLEYASQALSSLSLFVPIIRKLISKHKDHFLYGAVAADITLGKNVRGYSNNCHNWRVALDLFVNKAKNDEQKTFMLGYLSHLASDTVAHNFFVPYKLIRSWNTKWQKHVYWEMKMDLSVAEDHWKLMDYFCQNPFLKDDELLQEHLKRTIFSFKMNKKIFNRLMMVQCHQHYKKVAGQVMMKSSLSLADSDIANYKKLANCAVADFLKRLEKSYCLDADPTGKQKIIYARNTIKDLKTAKIAGALTLKKESRFLGEVKKTLERGIYEPVVLPELKNFLA